MGRTVFLLPGQGAQHVGMGKDLYEGNATARGVFDLADRELGFELTRVCFEGPEDRLNATDVSQPAIFVHSAAMLAALGEKDAWKSRRLELAAGLSLGEYSALYAADAMDFQVALRLVARRGQLMQQASLAAPSGMVSIIGLDEEQVVKLCAEAAQGQVLAPANFNSPGQIVISGSKEACERAVVLAPKFEARGAIPLKVAGAFHTALMAPAAAELAKAVAAADIRMPNAPVIANVTAKPYESVDAIRKGLVDQLTHPVRWSQSMERVAEEDEVFEIGPGKVLAGLMKRINRKVKVTNVSTVEGLAAV
ncbi:MAG: Malonyl CoA-acyl carrier protein transacylase [Phycisphaerae bacterium]|nr:Malonyl CoA-acyl carrier protein transacylase [Phycisphaerae bacterium]